MSASDSKTKNPIEEKNDDFTNRNEEAYKKLTPKFHQLIRIPVKFSNIETQALIDTGASTSLIDIKFLTKIPFENLKQIDLKDIPTFKSVSGDSIVPKGQYQIPIKIDNQIFEQTFFVIDRLDEGCILGIDFLTTYEVKVDIKNRKISYSHNKKQKTITIPNIPLNSIIVNNKETMTFPMFL